MHLVRFRFEPTKEAFYAIPKLRPSFAVLFAVIGLAIDNERLLFCAQRSEGNISRNFFAFGENQQVFLRLAIDFAFPALERAVID